MRKRLAIMLAAIIMLLPLCACGGNTEPMPAEQVAENTGNIAEKTEAALETPAVKDGSPVISVLVESREEAYPFPTGTSIKSLARVGSSLLLLAEREGSTCLGLCEYTLTEDGQPSLSEPKELQIAGLPYEDAIPYAVTAGGDGYFYLLLGNNENGASTVLNIQKYSGSGEYIESMEVPDWNLMTVDAFAVGANRELVLAADSTVCVYRWAEQLLKRSSGDFIVYSCSLSGAGIIISTFSLTDHFGHYSLVNSESGDLEELALSEDDPSGDDSLLRYRVCGSIAPCQGLNGEYLMNSGNSICRISFEDDTVEPLIEWNPDLNSDSEIGAACRLGENSYACLLGGKLILAWSHTVEKHESGIVRVGVVDAVASQNIAKTVTRMNTADCPYIYETTVFSGDEEELNRLRAGLAAGSFDLLVFHNEINTSSSSFEDLYPYLDADGELSRESFLPNLLESLSVKGELHQIWNSVMISTLIAQEEYVGDGRGLSIADCERIVAENDELQSVLDNRTANESALKQDLLLNIAYMAMTAFVDKENASCNFDSEEFMNLLSLCDRIKANPDSTGTDFLLYTALVGTADALPDMEETLGSCSYVGYPDGGDGIHYYQLPNEYENCMAAAIPSGSGNKEGAWYFIKTLLSRANQLTIANSFGTGFPVNYEVLKEAVATNASAEDAGALHGLLERTKYAELYGDATLREIIIDSSQAYLSGEKTLKETARLIQSKAGVYMAEQYG